MKKIRILIAEDHRLIRETWTLLLNSNHRFHVIAACHDSSEAVYITQMENPDIVLMDINIQPLNGFQATSRIVLISPESKVIALSVHNETSIVYKMLEAGAKGYVTKNSGREEIENAIVTVHDGNMYICNEVADAGSKIKSTSKKTENKLECLTKKETEVSQYIRDGLRSKDISSKMNISTRTVEAHRFHILRKLCIKNSLALIMLLADAEINHSKSTPFAYR